MNRIIKEKQAVNIRMFETLLLCFCRICPVRRFVSSKNFSVACHFISCPSTLLSVKGVVFTLRSFINNFLHHFGWTKYCIEYKVNYFAMKIEFDFVIVL